MLQQHLPFTVCTAGSEKAEEQRDDEVHTSQVPEQSEGKTKVIRKSSVEIVSTVYGIETSQYCHICQHHVLCCNSTYRLRYAPKGARQQRSSATMRSIHLKYLNEVKVKRSWLGNSPYRLRYAPQGARQQRSKATMRSAHLKCLSKAKKMRTQSLLFTVCFKVC